MTAANYKSLCRRIYQKFGKSLNLLYIDACELADPVMWGVISEDALFLNLQAQVSAEHGGNHD